MSQEDFKKIIDSARQILVGKLPNPQDQIDAITYTMMYKFMNDIDDRSASLPGGKRTYFANDYEKYSWHNLMRADGQDQLILYREAIEKMSKNPGLPVLFREIFNGAMLKFNDPRTLRLFLKEMDLFTHATGDHIGDAYEYLLSLMSSQGGLGQFRTPRHIIKFIVDAVDPDKNDKIMDPAAGTAGFLIAAYEHILHKHDGVDEDGNNNDEKRLSASELDKIHGNFRGFDIEPTMVRKSQVNMFLHGFKTPDIIEHDTLTSEDYWSDRYDVILANPPFMTPKGGIQPHKKFGVSANRAEVLFTDYITSHLKPTGRAGIVVPEGIIFQSGTAYKQLRKNLVENSLVAVVSLPAGVFNPYAGVKTSILLLDNEKAKKNDEILFIKVEADGFDLGAQRRPISKNDLPIALEIINKWNQGQKLDHILARYVEKSKIAENGDYNLFGDRYIANNLDTSDFDLVRVGDLIHENPKSTIKVGDAKASRGSIIFFTSGRDQLRYDEPIVRGENIFLATGGNANIFYFDGEASYSTDTWSIKSANKSKALTKFIYFVLRGQTEFINKSMFKGAGLKHLDKHKLRDLQIPLPPIVIQEKIIAEIENKQRAIDSAREVIASLERERRYFDPRPLAAKHNWPTVKLGDKLLFDIQSGGTPNSSEKSYYNGDINWATLVDLPASDFITELTNTERKITTTGLKSSSAKLLPVNTILVSSRATIGRIAIAKNETATNQGFKNIIIKDTTKVLPHYVAIIMGTMKKQMEALASGGTFSEISKSSFETLQIPLPPLDVQKQFVAEFAEQEKWIQASKETIAYMERKISEVLSGI